jgi:hypothetical protein
LNIVVLVAASGVGARAWKYARPVRYSTGIEALAAVSALMPEEDTGDWSTYNATSAIAPNATQ